MNEGQNTQNTKSQEALRSLIGHKTLLIDGAMGTAIQKASQTDSSIDLGNLPETLNITHKELIAGIHLDYLRAGADIITTNTFGANSFKFSYESDGAKGDEKEDSNATKHSLEQVISSALENAKKAQKDYGWEDKRQVFIAQDIGPLGKLTEPVGDMSFDIAYEKVKEQVVLGDKYGVDLFILETYTDIYELKAAILAVKENSETPFIASVTFAEDGRMLLGTEPETAVLMLEGLGIDAIGINCSLGPAQILPFITKILKISKIPVFVQPNAGMPRLVDGETVFDVGPNELALYADKMLKAGVSLIGGCCGTTPAHTEGLADLVKKQPRVNNARLEEIRAMARPAAASILKSVVLDENVRIIGERINPTGKKALRQAYINKDFDYVSNEAKLQEAAGAELIAVNAGLPDVDEEETLLEAIRNISESITAPLVIDCKMPEVMDKACRYYRGTAIINSISGEKESMDTMLPIAKKYGCSFIALLLDEEGVPATVEKRMEILDNIICEAKKYGISKDRLIVDALALTVSAEQDAALITLEAIRQITSLGMATTLGASNISFGLPKRGIINQTFLAIATFSGLSNPITDPTVPEYLDAIRSAEVLTGSDRDADRYIDYMGKRPENKHSCKCGGDGEKAAPVEHNISTQTARLDLEGLERDLCEIIISGRKEKAREATIEVLEMSRGVDIIDKIIVPALELVGERFEKNEIFLPQMVRSADTVKISFDTIRELAPEMENAEKYGKIVLATVKGDIHDIGKNIVGSMLENYGYEVIDLGKDVSTGTVVEVLEASGATLLGLSALMTTTMKNMEETVGAVKEKFGNKCKIMVGGAVLTPEYAEKMGADYYSKDALESVRIAQEVYGGR